MEILSVLPQTAKIDKKGHLEIGGCDTVRLVEKFGSPLFIMDEETIRTQCRRYKNAFSKFDPNIEIIYAGKAFISLAFCQILKEENLSLDVSSGGEIYLAHQAGFPMERTYFHGNNKTLDELELALRLGVGRIIVDSFDELKLLNQLGKKRKERVKILLRITPGIVPSTHTYVQTGQVDSKFGFGLGEGIAFKAAKQALSLPFLDLCGFHTHIGSQIFALHPFAKAVEVIMDFLKDVKEKIGFEAKELDMGGGLGIKYQASDQPSTIEDLAQVIVNGVKSESQRLGLKMPKVMVEPGRSIVGNACVTLYKIGTIKEIPGVRVYVSVDGGMSDNLRPMLYGAVYEAILANRANEKRNTRVTVVGKHCESGDILIKDAQIPKPKIGDILCTPATGAYGYVMSNNYNKQPRAAVVLAREGKAKLIIRRETYADLIKLECSLEEAEEYDCSS